MNDTPDPHYLTEWATNRIAELEMWQKEAIELLGVAKPTYQYCKEFKQWSKKKHELIEKAEPPCPNS